MSRRRTSSARGVILEHDEPLVLGTFPRRPPRLRPWNSRAASLRARRLPKPLPRLRVRPRGQSSAADALDAADRAGGVRRPRRVKDERRLAENRRKRLVRIQRVFFFAARDPLLLEFARGAAGRGVPGVAAVPRDGVESVAASHAGRRAASAGRRPVVVQSSAAGVSAAGCPHHRSSRFGGGGKAATAAFGLAGAPADSR